MKKLLCALLCFCLSGPFSYAEGSTWFEQNTILTHAHKSLLTNDLSQLFISLVQLWQQTDQGPLSEHLNQLLAQSITIDCGSSLDDQSFPEWLNGVTIQRQYNQSPGRDSYRAIVKITSNVAIQKIHFRRWPDKKVSSDSQFIRNVKLDSSESDQVYTQRYDLSNRLQEGLYRLTLKTVNSEEWSSWIIIETPQLDQRVVWAGDNHWKVEKTNLLNAYCPLPVLGVKLLDYQAGSYKSIWQQDYESEYPNSLDVKRFPNDRYLLSVAIKQKRWQGNIILENVQTISKTIDINNEQ